MEQFRRFFPLLLYTASTILLYFFSIPYLLYLVLTKEKYKISIPARFFLHNNPPLMADGIWFHVCSFGEAQAIRPIVKSLPRGLLRITTITQTGKGVIDSYTDQSRFLPFEPLLLWWQRPQRLLVVMEAELWYLLFSLVRHRGGKTVLVNARISDASWPRYWRLRWFYKILLQWVDTVFVQTALDRERFAHLGAKNVEVVGNIKLASLPKASRKQMKSEGLIVCAASTHAGEEECILKAFAALKREHKEARLVIAPRHPERFFRVSEIVEVFVRKEGVSWQCFSENMVFEKDILLLDTLGELINFYAISDIVIMGGAFEPIGGHNAAEAAQFGCKIISGEHYYNQRDIFDAIEGIKISSKETLPRVLLNHQEIAPAKIKHHTEITSIMDAIQKTIERE